MKNIANLHFENQYIVRNERMRWLIAALIFTVAFGIRLLGVTQVPLNYHPVKQYRAALTARAFYYSQAENIPDWQNKVAAASLAQIGSLGPPVVDFIAASVYSLMGSEILWIPKLLSSIYWILGGLFLYRLARKMMSEDAAIVASSIYLFLPFGVVSSQSFQPDPFMIMLLIMGLYMIVVHRERPSATVLFQMSLVCAVAIVVKPVSLFILFGAFFALQIERKGISRDLLLHRDTLLFIILSLLPSLLYYGYGILNVQNLDVQAQKSFIPQLLLDFNFWDGWLKRIKLAVGFTAFLGGMFGVFLYPNGWQKNLLFGLWIGYFVMCFAFTYTISTHDYYHLPLIPIIALSVGHIAEILLKELRTRASNRILEMGAWSILFITLFLSAGTNVQALKKVPDFQPEIELYEEIGRAVEHSTRTILLAPYDGKPLMYYGRLSGQYWPYWYDIRDEKLWGVDDLSPEERLQILSKNVDPQYFIVTDLAELENQSDLKQYLDQNYPTLMVNPGYVVYLLSTSP